MRADQNEPVQIDPQAYVTTLEEEVARLHGENMQLRAAVRHLRSGPPIMSGVEGEHPDPEVSGE